MAAIPASQDRAQTTPRPLRICLVTETFPPEVNGVAMTVARLAAGLREGGHEVSVVRPRQAAHEQVAAADALLVGGIVLPFYRDLRLGMPAGPALERLWRQWQPDVIYVATEGPLGWSAVGRAQRLGLPALSGFHTNFHSYSRHYGFGFLHRPIYGYLRTLHNRAACTLVPTASLKGQLERGGFERVEVLGRGVDTALCSPARRRESLRTAWGLGPGERALLYVGRLAPEKDLPLALESWRAMRQREPGLRLVLVGDGPLYDSLQRQHPELILCGARRGVDLAEHYASADIFLFPSRTETFGNVVLEAMASALAVVAFDYAGPRDLITHGRSGLLADVARRESFIETALGLIETPGLAGSLGKAAREASKGYHWQAVVARFEQLLRSCEGERS